MYYKFKTVSRRVNKLTGIKQWKEEALWGKILEKVPSYSSKLGHEKYWNFGLDRRRGLVITKEFVKEFFKCTKKKEIIYYLGQMAMYSNPMKFLERYIEEPYYELDTSYKYKRKVIIEKTKRKKV